MKIDAKMPAHVASNSILTSLLDFCFALILFHFRFASLLLPSCGLHSVRPSRIDFVFADSNSYLLIRFMVAESILNLLNRFTFADSNL